MIPPRTLPYLVLLIASLSPGCAVLPQFGLSDEARALHDARQEYTSAKTARARSDDPETQERLAQARQVYEDTALATANQRREQDELFQARLALDTALEQVPDSPALLAAREAIETQRQERLRINDCRLGAARAVYLVDKTALLQRRVVLDTKDYLQDWQARRERQELDQLGIQLRDCATQALIERQTDLAETMIDAAARVLGEAVVVDERQYLERLKLPAPQSEAAAPRAAPAKRPLADLTPQQRIRQTRVSLQSAITRGNLREAKALLAELRRLEGETPQLVELDRAISEAIAAYIADAHEQANVLYRERQIVQARDLWQKILELNPEDAEARTNLERAERVLKKLAELQGTSGDPATPPSPQQTPD
ncbi:MAG: hypothetical protein ABR553_05500 [Gammaproteobacteria bacterium]